MLAAVSVYNNPSFKFKAENFIVLSIISWTYLLHAYYKSQKIDYRYYKISDRGRKVYDKTKYGAKKYWELERCLSDKKCPLSKPIVENLRFLIGLRHEIEHQMTTSIDDTISARFQACCLNYNSTIETLFGLDYSISKSLTVSIQFSSISEPQFLQLKDYPNLPQNIATYIKSFDEALDNEIFNSSEFSYRIIFVPKLVNQKGQADKVFQFIKADSTEASEINKINWYIKEREKEKFLPKQIIELFHQKGYSKLNMYHFSKCWKSGNYKFNNSYGALVGEKTWYWYKSFF